MSNLRVENQALQAALERVRLELQEERELLERDRQEAEAASASVRIPVLAPLNGTKKVKGESGGWISRNTRRASHLGVSAPPPPPPPQPSRANRLIYEGQTEKLLPLHLLFTSSDRPPSASRK